MRWLKVIIFLLLALLCFSIANLKGVAILFVVGIIFEGLMWLAVFRRNKVKTNSNNLS
ncbi:hypothetical protein N7931_17935 [Catenovulum sp. 2E275]|uniref:hypothetical protein n=1 Tax=Catenovulum sp. 2E275 TaxID=2980497 RepID=UPI0021D00EF0|nr:hypothetical protein [Catenovulum sp. 2E275]MCU4677507.1 hypothetical protein [Catenovulum sp. 2E275]